MRILKSRCVRFAAPVAGAVVPLMLLSNRASAAVDLTAVTGALGDVGLMGAAVLGVYVAAKAFKWIRSSM
jgi:hypothetical protein